MIDALEALGKMIAAATFFTLLFVVTYEWGYFGVIGGNYQSLLTVSDYLANGVTWFAPTAVFMTVGALIQVAISRSEDFRPRSAKTWFGRLFLDYGFITATVIGAVFTFFLGDRTQKIFLAVLLAIIVQSLLAYILTYPKWVAKFSPTTFGMVTVIPAILVLMYFFGEDAAYSDLKDQKTQYNLLLKDNSEARGIKLLRLMEKGVLLRDPVSNAIQFYRLENVVSLTSKPPEIDDRSLSCKWFGWPCQKLGKAKSDPL